MFWIVVAIISGALAVTYLALPSLRASSMSDGSRRKFHRAGIGLTACTALSIAHFLAQAR